MYRSFGKRWHFVLSIIICAVICLWWFVESVFHVAPHHLGEEMPFFAKVTFYSVLTIDLMYILLIVYAGVSFDLFFLGWFGMLIIIIMIAFGLDVASRSGVGSRSSDAPTMSIAVALLALAITIANHIVALVLQLIIQLFNRMWRLVR